MENGTPYVKWDRCGPELVAVLRKLLEDGVISHVRHRFDVGQALERYERAADIGGPAEFMRARYGSNWVLARRTKNIIERYGADVVCLSHKQYEQCETDYYDGLAP